MSGERKGGKARDYYIAVDNMNSSEEQIFFSSGHNPEDGMQLEPWRIFIKVIRPA